MRKDSGTSEAAQKSKSNDATLIELSDLGISKQQSSDWQKLAAIPEEEFEGYLGFLPAGIPLSSLSKCCGLTGGHGLLDGLLGFAA